jgi:hypothetical protein
MPIHLGQKFDANVDQVDAGDGEALFELLATSVREMSAGEQLEVVTALQSVGWSALGPKLRARFDAVAAAYLDGGPPE